MVNEIKISPFAYPHVYFDRLELKFMKMHCKVLMVGLKSFDMCVCLEASKHCQKSVYFCLSRSEEKKG